MWFAKFIPMLCFSALVLVSLGNWSTAFPTSNQANASLNVCETTACTWAADNIRQRLNPLVDPCEDFFDFACGKFLNEPWNKSTVPPSLMDIRKKVSLELLELIKEPVFANDPQPIAMAKQYFMDCMAPNARETKRHGKENLPPWAIMANRIGIWPMLNERRSAPVRHWSEITAAFTSAGVKADHLVGVQVYRDLRNPMNRSIYIEPPDFPEPLTGQYCFNIMRKSGKQKEHVMNDVDDINEFIHKLKSIKDEAGKTYYPHSISELQKMYPYVNWVKYINDILPSNVRVNSSERVIVSSPDYLKKLARVLNRTTRRTMANYFGWRFLIESSFYFVTPYTESICHKLTTVNIPLILDAMYVRKFKNSRSRDAIGEILLRVREQMSSQMLSEAHWMDALTKRRAQEKINAIRHVVSYPEELLSDEKLEAVYRGLDLSGMSFFDATLKLKNFTANRALEKLRKSVENPLDWSEQAKSSQVNGFMDKKNHIIMIPEAAMQGQLFSVDRPKYLNYAAIGTIIGHEYYHAFDMKGWRFDGRGNYTDWWDPETKTLFNKRANCLVNQYSNFNNDPTRSSRTLSEDISDNGGVDLLYNTYTHWVSENEPEAKLPGLAYTPKQLFWIYYGQIYCGKRRDDYYRYDVHSPYRFRVLGPLSNSESFARDFNCPAGSKMNPETKCRLW